MAVCCAALAVWHGGVDKAGAAPAGDTPQASATAAAPMQEILSPEDRIVALDGTKGSLAEADPAACSAGEKIDKAIDGRVDTKFFIRTSSGTTGFVVAPAIGESTARRIRLATGNDMPSRDPLTITVEGSEKENAAPDGADFHMIYQGPSGLENDPGRNKWGEWITMDNEKKFRTYRVLVTATRDNTSGPQIAEVSLEGTPLNPHKTETPGEVKISFHSAGEPVPDGFIADTGRDFSRQGALTYGWEPGTKRAVQRKLYVENDLLQFVGRFVRDSVWQMAVENGMYEVSVCVGSSDDSHDVLPLLVEEVPFFTKMQAGKCVFLKQTRTVQVNDGKLTLRIDPARISKDWEKKNRFVCVPFIEIRRVEKAGEDRLAEWSANSELETDKQFYGLVPDIRTTSHPSENLMHTLWYRRPAKLWEEGVPLGNGRLGSVVYGNPVREVIQLNEDTLWNGAPGLPFANPDGKKNMDEARRMLFENKPEKEVWDFIYKNVFQRADGKFGPFMFDYMNGGDMVLNYPQAPLQDYYRSLDLSTGISTTTCVRDGVRYTQEVFSSAPAQVLVVRLTADKPGSISFTAQARDYYTGVISTEGNDTLLVDGKAPDKRDIASVIRYQRRTRILPEGGSVTAKDNNALVVEKANAVTILLSIRTNFVNYKDVSADPVARTKKDIADASALSYAALRQAHVEDHGSLYNRMAIDLGKPTTLDLPTDERIRQFRTSNDPHMAALVFQFGRYLIMGCSRPGTQAANLQGIWNTWTYGAWGGKYTVNINIQMNYWLPDPANLGELNEPFFDLIQGVADTGRDTARAYYGARGWVCHHNTDIWRYNHPIDGTAGMWPMASAWFCDHLWEHYQYTQDKEFLRRVYPIMREASIFYVDSLVKDPRSGWLVTAPSHSPENGGIRAAPTMDVQLLNSLFTRTCEAARILDTDADLRATFEQTRKQLPPMIIGSWGQLQEWTDGDFDNPRDHNRHVSHLYGLHPGDQITPWKTPQLFAAAKVSLLARGDEATGWSLGWKTNFWARLRDGNHAYDILKLLIKPAYNAETRMWGSGLYPNFFDSHPPFQIDGNFGAAAGIMEMLIQSQNGELDLLPALPSAWPAGSIHGMRVRGGFEVDMTWADSKVTALTIRAKGGTQGKIRHAGKLRDFTLKQGQPLTLTGRDLE